MSGGRHHSTRGTWRLARGAVVGLSAGALGLSAHLAGGASAPAPSLWLALTGGAVALSVLASRWQWTLPSLLLVFLGAQLGFHTAFNAYGAHAEHAGHLASTAPDPRMIVAHVTAAVVLATLMRFGETGLRSALDALLLRVVRLVTAGLSALPEGNQQLCVADHGVATGHDPATLWGSRAPPR